MSRLHRPLAWVPSLLNHRGNFSIALSLKNTFSSIQANQYNGDLTCAQHFMEIGMPCQPATILDSRGRWKCHRCRVLCRYGRCEEVGCFTADGEYFGQTGREDSQGKGTQAPSGTKIIIQWTPLILERQTFKYLSKIRLP